MISIFIPVRKGSKRISNKNTTKISSFKHGLVEIKVKQFARLRNIIKKDKNYKYLKDIEIIFSTDCKKTLRYISRFKWIKAQVRNRKLAGDDCLQDLINFVPKICKNEHILWTHVTSPCFHEEDYLDIIRYYIKNRNRYSIYTADFLQTFLITKHGKFISHNFKKKKWPRTQDLKGFYALTSAAFLSSKKNYFKYKDRLCNKPKPYISRLKSGFDIDNKDDLKFFSKFLIGNTRPN